MKYSILCVGKIKEKFYKDAIAEYLKRLGSYVDINIVEVDDEKDPHIISDKTISSIKIKEGKRLLQKIKDNDYVIALCIDGKSYDSVGISDFLKDLQYCCQYKRIVFVIGGSNGLSQEVISRADNKLSFSNFTFPHQLMRVILLEQIYRAHKIVSNEPYHK